METRVQKKGRMLRELKEKSYQAGYDDGFRVGSSAGYDIGHTAGQEEQFVKMVEWLVDRGYFESLKKTNKGLRWDESYGGSSILLEEKWLVSVALAVKAKLEG